MCQRYSLFVKKEDIEIQFRYINIKQHPKQSYNIGPTQVSAVITNDKPDKLQFFTWGLIPPNSTDGKNTGKLINARMESIATSNSFRMPFRERRCIVLADSFYVWKRTGMDETPFRVQLGSKKIMAFAGIWDVWYSDEYAIKSFSIITKTADRVLGKIADRMPVILNDNADQMDWLANITLSESMDLLGKTHLLDLKYYEIPNKINSVKYDQSDLQDEVLNPQPRFKL